jgi:mono/diheme cytochrome c family protein
MRPTRRTVAGNPVDPAAGQSYDRLTVIVRSAVALVLAALVAGALVAAGGGMTRAATTGSPDRGRAVYVGPGGCSGCHSASADPNEPSTGPQLTLATLQAHAADAGKPLAAYVAESILVPGAYAAPGYVSGMMQPPRGLTPLQIEDLVSYLIGKPWTSPAGGLLQLPKKPIAACEAKASCRATVARWARAERLPAAALAGAKIVAISGCLSCHRYAGSGVKSGSAPDLTRAGVKPTTRAAHVKRLRCPTCVRPGSVMPSYASLGDANLLRIAEFLRASRGTQR